MKDAVNYGASLWAQILESPVPIEIEARLGSTTGQVLAENNISMVFDANGVHVPCALQSKRLGFDACPNVPDMKLLFASPNRLSNGLSQSNQGEWYTGLDGQATVGQYDLVTLVMHEIGHGLISRALFEVDEVNGLAWYSPILTSVLSEFLSVCETGELLSDVSPEVFYAVVSGESIDGSSYSMCWYGEGDPPCDFSVDNNDSPHPQILFGAGGGKLGAHLNEDIYPTGNINSLMTPTFVFAENVHNPGPLFLCMLSQLGWDFNILFGKSSTTKESNYENLSNLFVIPNPSSGIVELNGIKESGNIIINSFDGKIKSELEFSGSSQSFIDCSHLPDGLYLITIKTPKRIYPLQKLLIQR